MLREIIDNRLKEFPSAATLKGEFAVVDATRDVRRQNNRGVDLHRRILCVRTMAGRRRKLDTRDVKREQYREYLPQIKEGAFDLVLCEGAMCPSV
jgi:hypothetical protein